MYRILSLFVLCALALTEAKFSTCDSPVGYVDAANVRITNCHPDSKRCSLKRGTNVSIAFDFTINKPVQSVHADVHGIVWGLEAPFLLPDADVCAHKRTTGIKCPLSKACGPFTYSTSLYINPSYPKWDVDVKWELKNEDQENIVCLMIPARITK